MRIAVGAVYQTVTRWSCENPVPAARRRTRPRRRSIVTPFVSGAMMPYDVPVTQPGIGRAPEDVVRVQVERELAGHVVRDDRLVHVHRALRRAGRAAREVQERHVVGCGRSDLVPVRPPASSAPSESTPVRQRARRPVVAGQEHVPQRREALAHGRHLAPVQGGCRDEHSAVTQADALLDRFGTEGREQRAEHGAVLSVPSTTRRCTARVCG